MLLWFFVIAAAVWLDQLSKWLVITYLPEGGVSVIGGVLRFTYVENTGAAFGILSDNRWVFIIVSTIALACLAVYLFKKKPEGTLLRCALAFIVGGGIGNMIDRVLLGYVVDFIDFCAFPGLWVWVFNIADSFVCIGAAMLMLYLLMTTVKEIKAEKAAKAAGSGAAAEKTPESTEAADAEASGTAEKADAEKTPESTKAADAEASGTAEKADAEKTPESAEAADAEASGTAKKADAEKTPESTEAADAEASGTAKKADAEKTPESTEAADAEASGTAEKADAEKNK